MKRTMTSAGALSFGMVRKKYGSIESRSLYEKSRVVCGTLSCADRCNATGVQIGDSQTFLSSSCGSVALNEIRGSFCTPVKTACRSRERSKRVHVSACGLTIESGFYSFAWFSTH